MNHHSTLLCLPGHDSTLGNPRRILDWLEHNARCFSAQPAVEGIERPVLTHAGLHEQVLETSNALLKKGIGRGDVVLVMLPNGPEALTAILATAAVAVALPIGMNEPIEAVAAVLSQSPARAILYDQSSPSLPKQLCEAYNLQPFPIHVDKCLPAGRFILQDTDTSQTPATPTCRNDAAILGRTAGTTSAPRIVAWSQASLYRSASTAADWMGLTDQDRSLCLMPFITLHTLVRSCIPGLLRGGSVICTPGFDKIRALKWIRNHHPTYMTAVPGIYRELLIRTGGSPQETSLRFLASGSDRIDNETIDQLVHTFNVPVREFYGMNEVSPMLAATPSGCMAQSNGAIGKPLDNWELQVRDDNGTLLPQEKRGRSLLGVAFSIRL